jgi:uncharacterized phage protein (TIGR02218 family)
VKILSSALQSHLNTGLTTLCGCWRIERTDGAIFGFTDHDRTLSFDGVDYEPAAGFTPSEMQASLGLAVDTMEVSGALSSDRITEVDIALGLWDDAAISVYLVNWDDVSERHIIARGSLGEVTRGQLAFGAEVRSLAHRLNQETGRTYQHQCDAVLGDGRCGFDLGDPDYNGAGAVAAVEEDLFLTVSGLGDFVDGWFGHGLLTWTSGDNEGAAIEIRRHVVESDGAVRLMLWQRAALPIAVGDAFAIKAGCDKTFSTCQAKFANGDNFRGFPHIPGNDIAFSTAKKEETNDGSSFFN